VADPFSSRHWRITQRLPNDGDGAKVVRTRMHKNYMKLGWQETFN